MSPLASSLVCGGCGWSPAEGAPYPFRCPNSGTDDADHVIQRALGPSAVRWPAGNEANPFVRYRELFRSYHLARSRGMTDGDYVELVERLDKEVAAVDGHGFSVTPLARSAAASDHLRLKAPGGLWVKDETGNVSGSHKARHLMGLLIHLEVIEQLGLRPAGHSPDLAIASCGNAALAAAVVARAGERTLQVFVPTWADQAVVARLRELGADVSVEERSPDVPGDPTYHALQAAIRAGALPFTCQGNENGLAIEGGETLGYELASQLAEQHVVLDRVFLQVGGGALASAVVQGLQEAGGFGLLPRMPRLHAVQTEGGHPLARAYDLVAERILTRIVDDLGHAPEAPEDEHDRADLILRYGAEPAVQYELRYAAQHRSEFMWPWEDEPTSIAHGILDDETYDWMAVVRGMIETGGFPVVVDEPTLVDANELARTATRIDVDHTGSSGLAGLLALHRRDDIRPDERAAVVFTGVRR